MRTEGVADAVERTAETSLAHAPDPTDVGVVTVYDPTAEGAALATQWFTVEEDLLCDVVDWC